MNRSVFPACLLALAGTALAPESLANATPSVGVPTVPPPGERKACQVNVTGAEVIAWTGTWREPVRMGMAGNPNVTTVSEYWMDDGEIRTAVGGLQGPSKSEAEKKSKVDAVMKRDRRLWMLILSCKTDEGTLILKASDKSGAKQVPLGPKSYKVAGGGWGMGEVGGAGEFAAQVIIKKTAYIVSGGTVALKKFDLTGVSGSFSLTAAVRGGKRIEIKGTFDYPCKGAGSRCKS